jgi:hypothetical protein
MSTTPTPTTPTPTRTGSTTQATKVVLPVVTTVAIATPATHLLGDYGVRSE